MDVVEVVYREDAGHWSAESPQVPELFIGAEALSELRQQTRAALCFYFERDVEVTERVDSHVALGWTPTSDSLWTLGSTTAANISRGREVRLTAASYGRSSAQAMPV